MQITISFPYGYLISYIVNTMFIHRYEVKRSDFNYRMRTYLFFTSAILQQVLHTIAKSIGKYPRVLNT